MVDRWWLPETTSGFNQRVLRLINNACHEHSKGGPCAISISWSSGPLTVGQPVSRAHSGIHEGRVGLPKVVPAPMAPALLPRSQKPSGSASGQASQSAWSLATISTQPGLSPSSVASSILGRTFCALRARSSTRGSATRRGRYVAKCKGFSEV